MTIDDLIAIRVMGWHEIDGGWGKWYNSKGEHVVLGPDWKPSTSIVDAWDVVKHMRTRGFCIDGLNWANRMGCNWPVSRGNACIVQFSREAQYTSDPNNQHDRGVAATPFPELSICIAALRAIGVTDDEIKAVQPCE